MTRDVPARIYLDHQAASPVRPEVLAAMRPWFDKSWGNPSSFHGAGLDARDALATARLQAAKFVHAAAPEEIVFTSGAAESLNLAIKGSASLAENSQRQILTSTAEPANIREILRFLELNGHPVIRVPVDPEGRLTVEAVRSAITGDCFMLVTHWTHPELGTIQPVAELAGLAAEKGIVFVVDATSAAGWHPVDVRLAGLSMVAFSTHRFGGPKGVGMLWRRRGERLVPLIHGGEQEGGLRAGTENVPAIIGAGMACELVGEALAGMVAETRVSQAFLWNRLMERIPYVKLNGPPIGPDRVPNLLHVVVEFVEGEGLVLAADFAGLAISSGHACANRALRVSPSLEAIGLPHRLAGSSVLLSLGPAQPLGELEQAADLLAGVTARLRNMSEEWESFESGKTDSMIVPLDVLADSEEVKALRLKARPKFGPRPQQQKPGRLPGF